MKRRTKTRRAPIIVEDGADPCAKLVRLRLVDPVAYRQVSAAIDLFLSDHDEPDAVFTAQLARIRGGMEAN